MRRAWWSLTLALAGCPGDDGSASDSGPASSGTSATVTSGSTGAQTTDGTTSMADGTEGPATGWQVVAELGPELGMAMSVWGPSADEVRVVGGQRDGRSSTGFVMLRSGGEWAPEALPAATPMLNWLGTAGSDVWTVGLDGAALRLEDGAWVAYDTGSTATLWGVWGSSTDEVWMVGGDGVTEPPVLLRFDGAAFVPEPLPALSPDSHALFKVWGADADHVFVAGDEGVLLRREAGAFVADTPGSIAPFISVWGRDATDVIAVGGRSNARIARWDGNAWQDVVLEPAGLAGVWIDADGHATLTGRLGSIFELPAGSLEPVPVVSPTNLLLHAVFGLPDGSRIAVGGSFEGTPPWIGVIVEDLG